MHCGGWNIAALRMYGRESIFLLTLEDGLEQNAAQAEVERIAREVLTNPVIEEFTFRLDA